METASQHRSSCLKARARGDPKIYFRDVSVNATTDATIAWTHGRTVPRTAEVGTSDLRGQRYWPEVGVVAPR
jgi:hypothetical protein